MARKSGSRGSETAARSELPQARRADESESGGWPAWAKTTATVLLCLHIAAVVAGALGVPPSSELERWAADLFTWHHGLLDQGYAYRYYAEPPPTPVVLAALHRADGSPDIEIRIPEREVPGPPMRRQRQLALANALFASARPAHRHEDGEEHGGPGESWLARSYASHLCRTNPGTSGVTLYLQQHLIPDPRQVLEVTRETGLRFDLYDESLLTTPRWIGDFPCDGL